MVWNDPQNEDPFPPLGADGFPLEEGENLGDVDARVEQAEHMAERRAEFNNSQY